MAIPTSSYTNLRDKHGDQQTNLLDVISTSLLTVNASLASIHTSPIVASENHIGEVGGNTIVVQVTPIVSLATYTANDCVGGGFAIPGAVRVNAGTGVLQSITLQDLSAKNAAMEIFLFKATSLTTYTDNAALDISDADLGNCIGWAEITASDYKSLSDNSVACVRNLGLPIKSSPATKSLYCVMRTTGTPTYLGTVDLKLTFGILRD